MGNLTPRSETNDPYLQILQEMRSLYLKKSHDYGSDTDPQANFRGSSGFGVEPWVGCLIRAQDKVFRLQRSLDVELANESVEDSLMDAASYFIHALVLYRERTCVDVYETLA